MDDELTMLAGQTGSLYVTGPDTVTGDFSAVEPDETATFSATGYTAAHADLPSLERTRVKVGRWSEVDVTAGSVIVYRARPA